jgi:class 3 adenylate cyclase
MPTGPRAAAPAPREPRAYTPRHLAKKILSSRAALEGERKQVTVAFADVKGLMELAEALDPEEWHRILERFFEILPDGVHPFEGTVNQYTDDGIMALLHVAGGVDCLMGHGSLSRRLAGGDEAGHAGVDKIVLLGTDSRKAR